MSKNAKAVSQDIAAQLDLKPGQSIELLKALHILTRDGKLNQDSRRKLKQVYHLYQFIEPILNELGEGDKPVTLADHGAGKSYLGFILYDLYFKHQAAGSIYGIETRAPLVESSQKLAAELGFARMHFLNMSVAESTRADFMPERFDVVTALHACDTATDDAIAFGLEKKAKAMVLVPCCQAEVAACLRQTKALSLAWPRESISRPTSSAKSTDQSARCGPTEVKPWLRSRSWASNSASARDISCRRQPG